MSRGGAHDWPPVAETIGHAGLPHEAADLATDDPDGSVFLDRLRDAGRFPDAVRYLAFALSKREAVWWACRCARLVPEAAALAEPGLADAAIAAAERWVAEPSEPNRRAAGAAGEAAGVGNPAGCAAMAAFWSGGSLAPEGVPDVPPADDLTARGIAGAVMIAAVAVEPQNAPERFGRFLDLGLAIARGMDRWPGDRPSPSPSPESDTSATPPRSGSSSRFLDTWE